MPTALTAQQQWLTGRSGGGHSHQDHEAPTCGGHSIFRQTRKLGGGHLLPNDNMTQYTLIFIECVFNIPKIIKGEQFEYNSFVFPFH